MPAKKKAPTKKREPMQILQPGQTNDFWDDVLRIRDSGDSRWREFSHGFRYSAEQYEINRAKGQHEQRQAA
jgi:hypothetical protein